MMDRQKEVTIAVINAYKDVAVEALKIKNYTILNEVLNRLQAYSNGLIYYSPEKDYESVWKKLR